MAVKEGSFALMFQTVAHEGGGPHPDLSTAPVRNFCAFFDAA